MMHVKGHVTSFGFLYVLILFASWTFTVCSAYCPSGGCEATIRGPVEVDVIYETDESQNTVFEDSRTNSTQGDVSVTVGDSTSRSWTWNITGGGQCGNSVAQANFGFNIGYSDTVSYHTEMASTVPGKKEGHCCGGCEKEATGDWTKTYTHHYILAKDKTTYRARRWKYWYSQCSPDPLNLGNLIRSSEAIGCAEKNDWPVSTGMVCETWNVSYQYCGVPKCQKSRFYQNPYILQIQINRYTPEDVCFTNAIGNVNQATSTYVWQRSCSYDEE